MRVLVNALPLRYGGGVTYLTQQLHALARVAPEVRIHTLLSPWTEAEGLPGSVETVQVNSVPARFAYEQLRLGLRRADVLYCPANFAPVVARPPVVLTIHNANYYRTGLALPETRPLRPPWKVRANHLAMRRAAAVVAISESLADDARATVPGARRRLRVIRSGAPEWPAHSVPVPGLPESFVVSVASGAPHKRVEDVVAGWAHAVADLGAARVALVLVGDHGAEQQARHAAIAGPLRDSLIHVGRLSDRGELKWIYEHALAMVSMSVLEAFPLTPAEAGSVGCPLILSDIPPHREVAGEHAAFVPPRDVGALAKAMVSATHSPDPGTHRWQWPVSWEDNAAQLMTVFRSVLPPGRSRS